MIEARLSQKIRVPMLPPSVLHRKNLVQMLVKALELRGAGQYSPHKLVLLCAPAGYGKTTLLVDAVSQISGTCCWYTLDDTDVNPSLFLQGLLASIQNCLPNAAQHSILSPSQSETDAKEHAVEQADLFDALGAALKNNTSQPFTLVLCNYHEINSNEIVNHLVDRLIECLPEQGTIVIESRAMPNLTLASLIARRQMFGIGNYELRFTAQEIYDLARLQSITALSYQEAEQLAVTFEGWIAGVLLGSRLGYSRLHHPPSLDTESWSISGLMDDNVQIMAYIENEVFKHEASTYEFLKKTSLFPRLTPESCNMLLEINDASERLAYAEQRGLFVVRDRENMDENLAKDYICHPVLRQLFAEHLCQQTSEHDRALYGRAIRLLQSDHQYELALAHAYQAQEHSLAVNIILEVAPSFTYEEQSEKMLRWLEMLPEEIFKHHPQLLLIASNIHLRHGKFALVPPLLDAADALLHTASLEQDQLMLQTLHAEMKIARGHLLFSQGEFQHAQKLCQQALNLLLPDERRLHIRAHQYIGVSLIVGSGQVQEGITHLHQALQMSKTQQDEPQIAILHRLVANAYSWIGNHALAEHHQARALQIWEKRNNAQGIIYSLTSMGLLKMRQGLTQQAENFLNQALHQARETYHFKSGEAYALVALGDLQNNLGQYTASLNYLEDGLNLAHSCEDHYLICCSLCYLTMTYLFMNDMQTAQFFLNQVVLKKSEENSFEGLLFHLTQGTVHLALQNYNQAEAILEHTMEAASKANIQILSINALLRLSVCYLRQGKKRSALQTGKRIAELNKKGDFDFFLQVELRHYSELPSFLDQISSADHGKQTSLKNRASQDTMASEIQSQQPSSSFHIQALGEPNVLLQGVPVTRWRMARAMELFFFLLEKDRPLRKDQIIVALWPEHDSDQIDSTIRTTIYYLRKALGESSVTFQAGLYGLNPLIRENKEVWYDVKIFEEHYSRAKKALDGENDKAAATEFMSMVELYHGDYLQPFYNDWCFFRRDKLRQAYMDARHQLALIAWRQSDWENSLHHWQHLITIDSCNETAHYGIMRCYLQQEKRELALRQFQRCSEILREELQATPRASLQELYQTIIEGA